MAKHEKARHEHRGMAGEHGMSPRKAMASGKMDSGSFGAESFERVNGGAEHPDMAMRTGERETMKDHERATGPAIHHTKGHLPSQAAPRHGPHNDHFDREGKV